MHIFIFIFTKYKIKKNVIQCRFDNKVSNYSHVNTKKKSFTDSDQLNKNDFIQ